MDASAESYFTVVFRHWKAVVWTWLGGAGAIVGLTAMNVFDWPWWLVIAVLVLGLCVAQWLAWRDMQEDRDRAETELGLILNRTKYGLTLETVGLSLRVGTGDATGIEVLELSLAIRNHTDVALKYQMEKCSVTVNGAGDTHLPAPKPPSIVIAKSVVRFGTPAIRTATPRPVAFSGGISYQLQYWCAEADDRRFDLRHTFRWRAGQLVDGRGYLVEFSDVEGPTHREATVVTP